MLLFDHGGEHIWVKFLVYLQEVTALTFSVTTYNISENCFYFFSPIHIQPFQISTQNWKQTSLSKLSCIVDLCIWLESKFICILLYKFYTAIFYDWLYMKVLVEKSAFNSEYWFEIRRKNTQRTSFFGEKWPKIAFSFFKWKKFLVKITYIEIS